MIPVLDLMKPMTEEECFTLLLNILRTLGLPVDTWRKGGALRVIVRACARIYAVFSILVAAFVASGFLETATGHWLTKLAKNVYGVDRRVATVAREKIRLKNNGGGLYEDQVIGSVTVFNPITKKAYRNAELFTLNPFETKEFLFDAVEAGAASASAPNTITSLETELPGVEVTNLRAFVGIDEEQDAELRQACLDKLGAMSVRGPRSAYAWAIREAKRVDGNPVNINRSRISSSSSTGKVFVWLASPTGAPVADDITAVEGSIERLARPDTVTVITAAATEVPVSRTIVAWVRRRDGVDAAGVRSKLLTAYVQQGAQYPIGGIKKSPSPVGKLYADWLAGVAKEAWSDVYDVDGTGDDTVLAEGQVAALSVDVSVRFEDAA